MNCSTRWLGTMPESLRVRRRKRTIMAPTQDQYIQTVAASTMQGRSVMGFAWIGQSAGSRTKWRGLELLW